MNITPGLMPLMPLWPAANRWPVNIENQEVILELFWEKNLDHCHVAHLELDGEVDGQAPQTLATLTPDLRVNHVTLARPLPDVSTRYRWRIFSPDGAATATEWSLPVERSQRNLIALQQAGGEA